MTAVNKVLIVSARFYDDMAAELVRGAKAVLDTADMPYDEIEVPGVFEIPAAIRMAMHAGKKDPYTERRYEGYIALGVVIRGETTHYDYVCNESARALMDISTHDLAPLGYGIVTAENADQAWARCKVDQKNKGGDVAAACLRMIEISNATRQGLTP